MPFKMDELMKGCDNFHWLDWLYYDEKDSGVLVHSPDLAERWLRYHKDESRELLVQKVLACGYNLHRTREKFIQDLGEHAATFVRHMIPEDLKQWLVKAGSGDNLDWDKCLEVMEHTLK